MQPATARQPIHDATVKSAAEIKAWVFKALHGQRCLYHTGQMVVDQEARPGLRGLGECAQLLHGFGVITLVQRRVDLGQCEYLALRTRRSISAIPRAVAMSEISARQWIAAKSIRDRLGNVSARRAIRDRLSCTEKESDMILIDLVLLGVVTSERPSILTPYGMGMLT